MQSGRHVCPHLKTGVSHGQYRLPHGWPEVCRGFDIAVRALLGSVAEIDLQCTNSADLVSTPLMRRDCW